MRSQQYEKFEINSKYLTKHFITFELENFWVNKANESNFK